MENQLMAARNRNAYDRLMSQFHFN